MAFTSHADAAFDVCFDNTMTDCMYPTTIPVQHVPEHHLLGHGGLLRGG
jgi:hypothetical protein